MLMSQSPQREPGRFRFRDDLPDRSGALFMGDALDTDGLRRTEDHQRVSMAALPVRADEDVERC